MKKYIEFFDAKTRNHYSAVDELNDFIAENKNLKIRKRLEYAIDKMFED